jgi:hypothetical protein
MVRKMAISRQRCGPRGKVAHASSGYSLLEDREKWAPPSNFWSRTQKLATRPKKE